MSTLHERSRTRLSSASALQLSSGGVASFEPLEGRVLLSGGEFGELGVRAWYGAELDVVAGSWVASFETAVGSEAEALERIDRLGWGLGVSVSDVEVLGLGYAASLTIDGRVS